MTQPSHQVTKLLKDWSDGDQSVPDQLMPLVYDELRRLAHQYMRREKPGHTLQTTALVNEAYVRLVDQNNIHWESRAHFFGIAARLMRQILVDQARRRNAKGGGGAIRVSLNEATTPVRQDHYWSVGGKTQPNAKEHPQTAPLLTAVGIAARHHGAEPLLILT
jgi:RNA polymerase sigma factor (TIGR02999 family)